MSFFSKCQNYSFQSTGRIIAGPESLFYDCLIGTEFAGRRTDSGERVCGFSLSRCIATSVDVREDLITEIPEKWSMEDAVTVMTTYCTVWYGLIERAQMQRSIKICIHER
jgi:NADPH:quinone reductase-like Zn-dependent oxidoreductase